MKDQIENGEMVSLERLLFRRQFLLGPEIYTPNQYWSYILLPRGLYLSVHNDLPFATTSQEGATVTLIGHAIDPYHPLRTNTEVLLSLIENALELHSLIDVTKPLVGRWILIFQNHQGTYLFTDPCSFRQVFYHSDGKQVWCASQPELIRANRPMSLNTDVTMRRFLIDQSHAKEESAWVGSSTMYSDCFHLMPNHYLNMECFEQTRFYPSNSIQDEDFHKIVELSSAILQGTMTALTARHDVSMALTAGWDSRVLLAASKHVSERIEYFVYRHGNMAENHPDIWVPGLIAKKLGLKFVVKKSVFELPGWFVSMLSHNVSCARILPKTHTIYQKLITGENRININGNGSEICRNYFDKYCKQDFIDVSSVDLATKLFGKKVQPEFAIRELNKWKETFDYQPVGNWNILDFLYWEQKMGNWGAQYPAEQDIAIEEISPFNCRQLLEILLSSPRNMRSAPDYIIYKEMIRHMWPEALSFPVNPLPKGHFIDILKQKMHRYIPSSMELMLKRFLKS